MEIRAILFDLDGTLADTLGDLANATNQALCSLGLPAHPLAAYRQMVGDGARVLCQRATPADRQELVPEVLRRMQSHYAAHCFDQTRLYAGIPELVAALRQRGRRLAVLSNKPDEFTGHMVNHFFPDHPFDVVRGHRDGEPLKPDPTVALAIAAALGIPASQWLYLGDTNTDMATARAAGMRPVGVLWGFRDRAELVASGAAALVATPAEVLGQL